MPNIFSSGIKSLNIGKIEMAGLFFLLGIYMPAPSAWGGELEDYFRQINSQVVEHNVERGTAPDLSKLTAGSNGLYKVDGKLYGYDFRGNVQEFRQVSNRSSYIQWSAKVSDPYTTIRAGYTYRYVSLLTGRTIGERQEYTWYHEGHPIPEKWNLSSKDKVELNGKTDDLRNFLATTQHDLGHFDPKTGGFILNKNPNYGEFIETLQSQKEIRGPLPSFAGDVLNAAAWKLATSPTATRKDKEYALTLAKLANEAKPDNAEILDTLAAAHAANGDFKSATEAQIDAISNISPGKSASSYSSHLKLYRQGKPYTEEAHGNGGTDLPSVYIK